MGVLKLINDHVSMLKSSDEKRYSSYSIFKLVYYLQGDMRVMKFINEHVSVLKSSDEKTIILMVNI